MWSFKRWRERKKLHAAFSPYLPKDIIDDIVNNPRPFPAAPQPARLCFILLQVRDDPLERMPEHMATAFDILLRREGMVWDTMSSLTLATFGLPISDDPGRDRDQRTKSVAHLMTELGADVRLVYGTVDGFLGNCGSPERFHYGPMLPGFARYLQELTKLEFGQAAEIPAT
jgi:hypothetical protein